MPYSFEKTNLWKKTLAEQEQNDSDKDARQRLRNVYLRFRERVTYLAGEIHRHLPDYTVHDITHLDALWEMTDIIAGPDYVLTPTEAFVLGGAILLHDLGMGLASYPRGIDELREEAAWADVVTAQFQSRYERFPTPEEIKEPPDEIKRVVIETLLRNLHATHAEQLAFVNWKTSGGDSQYLIEDNEIRLIFGRSIGRIAHSHWWSIPQIESEFTRNLGAPPWCPNDWIVDPLKIACLLRVGDASHIDSRRAPSFLRSIRKPSKYSDEHWKFQEKLQKPFLSEDALTYSSGYAFPLEDAPSWWLCLDTLKMIDKELRQVDALLADKRSDRFAARRVAAVDSPERLVNYIPTDRWLPVNAFIQVSDVPRLVRNLGGEELYGREPTIPLRELIQNAADAIRARRIVEDRAYNWGEINVRLGQDEQGDWLEVEDNGIGMSSEVLTKYLLDFGTSYWRSNQMLEDYPGLLARGFKPTGKYGIGFFSVFMIGDAIRIRTRKADAGQDQTLVLEFNTGLSKRPILRPALAEERIRDGGTIIKIWLTKPPREVNGLLYDYNNTVYLLNELCQTIAPSLDVNLKTTEDGESKTAIEAFDWITCDIKDLIKRVTLRITNFEQIFENNKDFFTRLSNNLRLLRNENDEIVGRACVSQPHLSMRHPEDFRLNLQGVITIGGFKANNIGGIIGILTGTSNRAIRDRATVTVSREAFSEWLNEQKYLIPILHENIEDQMESAAVIWRYSRDVTTLPIAKFKDKYVTYSDLATAENLPDEIILLDPYHYEELKQNLDGFILSPNVILVNFLMIFGRFDMLFEITHKEEFHPDIQDKWNDFTVNLAGAVLLALSEAWNVSLEAILSEYDNNDNHPVVGQFQGNEIKEYAKRIRKPKILEKGNN
ncbi:MAG TPA: ATP-binding protein [Pyrinomonadaceae bacterium]